MLHTNYQCHRFIGSEEDFESILTIFGLSCDPDCLNNICFLSPRRLQEIGPSGYLGSGCMKLSYFNSPG